MTEREGGDYGLAVPARREVDISALRNTSGGSHSYGKGDGACRRRGENAKNLLDGEEPVNGG